MDGRKRTVQIKFRVTEAERDLILEKMKLVPTRNMAAYLRKIAIDGYIIQIDHADIKAMTAEIQKIGVNVNQIARRVKRDGERIPRGHRGNKGGACGDMAVTKIKPIKSTLNKTSIWFRESGGWTPAPPRSRTRYTCSQAFSSVAAAAVA